MPGKHVLAVLCSCVWSVAMLWEAYSSFVYQRFGFGCFPRGLIAVHPGYSAALFAIGNAISLATTRMRSARREAALLVSIAGAAFALIAVGGVDHICWAIREM